MEYFEYKVIPAPRRGVRVKGAKGTAGRFAGAMEVSLNELAADGWEYVRAESLPVDERHGITRRKTETYQNILIFRRLTDAPESASDVTALIEDQTDQEEDLSDDTDDDFPEDEQEDVAEDTPDEDDTEKEEEKV